MEKNNQNNIEKEAYRYFCDLNRIPRGSGNEKGISDYLVAFAKENGWEVVQDTYLNVLIRKPGSTGRENEAPVILQAHMDMVCEKNEGVRHDFLKDPIIPVVEGDWVKAKGTTLGADNGSGVAYIMAVLAAKDISHPPLEMILTTEEETGCSGAANFDVALLKGRRLINLDGIKEGLFVASCAGGVIYDIIIPVEREKVPAGFTFHKMMLKGLTGGHSGGDIDKGRGNANVLMAKLLGKLFHEGIFLSDIKGGAKMNAIPRECSANICFAESSFEKIKSIVAQTGTEYKSGFPNDPDLSLALEKTDAGGNVLTSASLRKIIDTILNVPAGVQSMSPDIKGLVQTSNNPAVISGGEDTVVFTNFLRSSDYADMDIAAARIKAAAESAGAELKKSEGPPIWEYRADSPLREKMAAVYKEMSGEDPVITTVHGGLECAVFAKNLPGGDFATIGGPNLFGLHSPDEKMNLSSFYRTCSFLVKVLEKL